MDYKETLNLPRTGFPMKANLVEKEPKILEKWAKIRLYEKMLKRKDAKGVFVLHDGPPYADGDLHIGHALNKTLKDIIIRYRNMTGYVTPFVPGWDCHGMPIEYRVIQELGDKAKTMSKREIRRACEQYALKYVNLQKEGFIRLGVVGDWEHPYLTMDPKYEARTLEVFQKLIEGGYIYRAKRPVHWCTRCQTALAEAEIEYEEHTSPSVYLLFDVQGEEAAFLVWTTTPWTLLGNVAVALHPDAMYVYVRHGEGVWILAEPTLKRVMDEIGVREFEIVKRVRGKDLEGKLAYHPFIVRDTYVINATFVVMEQGTGCVHIAPGHGYEDYLVGIEYNLPIVSPVDAAGRFTREAGEFSGMYVFDANDKIVDKLREVGKLVKVDVITHSYPHCWRCHSPLIFRATPQWFLDVEHNGLKRRMLEMVENRVSWVPRWSRERSYNTIRERPDWCLSRQRSWGIPIPVLYCKKCGEPLLEAKVVEKVRKLVEQKGSEVWFEVEPEELGEFECMKCGGREFAKEEDIFDVWFDSSCSFYALKLDIPVDLYLEAVDQHRGWFQHSLLLATAVRGEPPFKRVLTHGLILDKNYRKMSKHLGNVVTPREVWSKWGADILRLYLASVDYTQDVAFDEEKVAQVAQDYRKIRNVFRYILGNLYDFDYERDKVEYERMMAIDRYMLHKLQEVIRKVRRAYEDYAFYKVIYHYHNFIVYLSRLYLDVLKDRLYTYGKESVERRSAQTALYEIMGVIVRLIAPIMPFTAEEAWEYFKPDSESVQLESMPEVNDKYVDEKLAREWELLERVREDVLPVLEQLRRGKVIGNSLEARVIVWAREEIKKVLLKYRDELAAFFIVSEVVISDEKVGSPGELVWVKAERIPYRKCERCWIHAASVGKDETYPTLCAKCVEIVKNYGR